MKLHALVDALETARIAVEGGATVVQWRLKDVPCVDVVERGRATRSLCARHGVPFVVNSAGSLFSIFFTDQPVTGRYTDYENSGLGLVDVADTPHYEAINVLRNFSNSMYANRG